jgi:putative ABC transport system permease protein
MAIAQDFREGVRALRQQPGFTIAAAIAFALAIGTNTAIFAALYAVVLKPLPFADPSRLVIVWRQDPQHAHTVAEVSYRQFRDWSRHMRSFDRLAAMSSVNWSFTRRMPNGEQRKVKVAGVSDSFFPTLGVSPALGRAFLPEEDRRNAPRVVILSDGFWTREFARDPSIIGRTITFENQSFTIVGVMPRGFAFPYAAEVWSPVATEIAASRQTDWKFDPLEAPGWGVLFVVGRLKAGVPPQQAKQELDAFLREQQRTPGMRLPGEAVSVVTPLMQYMFGDTRLILLALGGTGAIVLLIACANIVGLLLVRALARRRDFAIRLALGASRWRTIRVWLTESLLLAGVGLIAGVLLAWWGARALVSLAPADTPRLDDVGLNLWVLLFACAVCLLSAIGCAIVPAWVASRPELRESLKDGARQSEGRSRRRARHTLVIAQLAMAMVLLVAAGLMIRSVINLRQLDLGYNPDRLLTVDVGFSVKDAQQRRMQLETLLTRIRAFPEVESAGAMLLLPLVHGPVGWDATVGLEGQTFESMEWMKNPIVNHESVTPGLLETMGTRLTDGRLFTARDTEKSQPVVIVSESAARRLWPGKRGVGQRLMPPGPLKDAQGKPLMSTVVGVVQDARYRGINDVRLDLYVPHEQDNNQVGSVVVRTTGDPVRVAGAVREAVREIDPQAIVGKPETMEAIVGRAMAPWRFAMLLFTVLSTVAFALAITGLFGVISYAVAQRDREIAVRLALGALPSQVRAMIVWQGAALVGVGVVVGVVGAAIAARMLAALLFGIAPLDGATFAAVAGLVAGVALLACHLAAGRTGRIDAVTLLR